MKLTAASRLATLSLALTVPFAGAAFADEVWANRNSTVVWEAEDVGGYAVFSFTQSDAKIHRTGYIFVYGLRGDMTDRATFGGYWTSNDGSIASCPMPVIDANGNENWSWGYVELTFDSPAFPSGWSAAFGHCFDQAVEFWTVEPVTGGEPGAGGGVPLK